MHFFLTEFVNDWLFRVFLLVVRNWVRPTFRDPEIFMKTTVLYILKDRNDAGWSPTVCMWCPFRNTVGYIDSVHPNGYPTSFPGSSPTRGPSGRGPWERGWWLPPNALTSQCLVTSFISVLRRSAWWEIMGLLDVRLVTFILSQCHFERHVK